MQPNEMPTEFSTRQIADATGLDSTRPILALLRREGVAYRRGTRLWHVKGPDLQVVEPDYYRRCMELFGKKRQP